jgi:hypothetical protein
MWQPMGDGCALSLIRARGRFPREASPNKACGKGETWMCCHLPRAFDHASGTTQHRLAWGCALECIRRSKCIPSPRLLALRAHSSGPDDTHRGCPLPTFHVRYLQRSPARTREWVTVSMSLLLVCFLLPVLARHTPISTSRCGDQGWCCVGGGRPWTAVCPE